MSNDMSPAPVSKFRIPIFIALAVLAFAGALIVPMLVRGDGAQDPADTMSLIGKPAPDFKLDTVAGPAVKLADLKGNVVLLDFWATWCPPCRASLPHIQHLSQDKEMADKGLKVLAINDQEDKDTAQEFLSKNNFTFVAPLDSQGETLKSYLVTGIPSTVIVGRDGTIKKVFVGFNGNATVKEIDEAVAAALKEETTKK